MYRPLEDERVPAREPAPLGPRLWAGLLDLVATVLIATLFMAFLGGGARPLVSIVGAVLVWSVAPLVVFGATHGMRLFGLVLVDPRTGAEPGFMVVLFRELLGRGMLALGWLGTSLLGLGLALFGGADFVVPQGPDLWLELLAVLLLAGAMAGHLGILARADRRGLADRMAHTVMRSARAEPRFGEAKASRWRRLAGFVLAQGLVVTVATAGPPVFTAVVAQVIEWEERRAELDWMRKRFADHPEYSGYAQDLVQRLKEEDRPEEAAEIARRHAVALQDKHAKREVSLREALARYDGVSRARLNLVEFLEKDGRVDEASAILADGVYGIRDPGARATYALWPCRWEQKGGDLALARELLKDTYVGSDLRDLDLLRERRPALAALAEKVPGCEAFQKALAELDATLALPPKP